jgi:ABC-type amino acid transport substrate-binding protein
MTGTAVTLLKLGEIAYTIPYLDATLAFIVKDHRRSEFRDMNIIRKMKSVRIGVYQDPYYISKIRELLPDAEVIPLDSPRPFFRGATDLDALAFTAESGGAWSIIYPEFSVAVPRSEVFKVPMAYVVSRDDQEFLNFINTWIYLKKADGTFDSAFGYWVMGRGIQETREPRWSVVRNVLEWVD